MTTLQKSLNDYLALRRALGYKLAREGLWLPDFVRLVEQKGSFVTTAIAQQWAKGPKNPYPKSWTSRLTMARKFTHYLHAIDSRHEVPLQIPVTATEQSRRFIPFIYSDDDIISLMKEAKKNTRISFKAQTISTLIGLLAATGLRVGEAIRLDKTDFDSRNGVLLIRNTKFGKTRQIPIHHTTTKALLAYSKLRDKKFAQSNPAFFVSIRGQRILYINFQSYFHKLVIALGLGKSKTQSPRLHDLRHTFALKTLTRWYRAGQDPSAKLPALSTYLGHVSPSSTYVYFHSTPELLQQAKIRLEKLQGAPL